MEQKRCISSFTLAELTAELKAMGHKVPGSTSCKLITFFKDALFFEYIT